MKKVCTQVMRLAEFGKVGCEIAQKYKIVQAAVEVDMSAYDCEVLETDFRPYYGGTKGSHFEPAESPMGYVTVKSLFFPHLLEGLTDEDDELTAKLGGLKAGSVVKVTLQSIEESGHETEGGETVFTVRNTEKTGDDFVIRCIPLELEAYGQKPPQSDADRG